MEKRISFFEFQSVKSVAKAIEPKLREQAKIKNQMEKLANEYKKCDADIAALESGVVSLIGFHVKDLIHKIVEETGRVDKEGNAVKVTKYVPSDIVTYDDTAKQYVIKTPDEESFQEEANHTEEEAVGDDDVYAIKPPVPEAGNDFDVDGDIPFDEPEEKNEEIF